MHAPKYSFHTTNTFFSCLHCGMYVLYQNTIEYLVSLMIIESAALVYVFISRMKSGFNVYMDGGYLLDDCFGYGV